MGSFFGVFLFFGAGFWHFQNLTGAYLASKANALLELFCH